MCIVTDLIMFQAEPGSDPLQCVTNIDVSIPPEKVADMTGFMVDIINPSIMELRRLFLLESIFDTLKFILCLWGLTYIGSWSVEDTNNFDSQLIEIF